MKATTRTTAKQTAVLAFPLSVEQSAPLAMVSNRARFYAVDICQVYHNRAGLSLKYRGSILAGGYWYRAVAVVGPNGVESVTRTTHARPKKSRKA